jgi:hypothetical protein
MDYASKKSVSPGVPTEPRCHVLLPYLNDIEVVLAIVSSSQG